jgi:hypothetical protein
MDEMPYWIQRADFSTAEYEAVDVERAIELLTVHDWADELRLVEAPQSQGREVCQPGIGFVAAPGHILHICPARDGTALVHYHFSEERKMLWFVFTSRPAVRSGTAASFTQLSEFVRRFYAGDHRWLFARTSAP